MFLVTGGAGFIGSHFVESWCAGGDSVINLDRLTYAGSRDHLAALQDRAGHVFVPAMNAGDTPGHDQHCAPDTAQIMRKPGWAAAQPPEAVLAQTLRWYLKHRPASQDARAGHANCDGQQELVSPLLQT